MFPSYLLINYALYFSLEMNKKIDVYLKLHSLRKQFNVAHLLAWISVSALDVNTMSDVLISAGNCPKLIRHQEQYG